jgi:hypothetical protein
MTIFQLASRDFSAFEKHLREKSRHRVETVTAFDSLHGDHQKVRLDPEGFWLMPGYFGALTSPA